MTTFDRHIMFRLFRGFVFLVAILIVFFVVLHYVEYGDDFYDRGATFRQVFLTYYPSYIPEIVKLVSPVALFLACIYVTGKLAQELQLAALATSGVSLYRLMIPYLVVGAIITGGMFWFNGWIVPESNQTRISLEARFLDSRSSSSDNENLYRQNRPGSILTANYFDSDKQIAYDVSLVELSEKEQLMVRIDSKTMQWNDSLKTWRMVDAVRRSLRSDSLIKRTIHPVLDTTLRISPRDLARTEHDVDLLTLPDAAAYIESLRAAGVPQLGRQLVAYYSKYTYPLANFILLLVGIPLASVRRRGGQAVQIAIGFALTFVYLALIKLTEPFGYAGTLPPIIASWLPHAAFFILSFFLLVRARK